MRECLGKCCPCFLRGTNIIELVPPTSNTGTSGKKGSQWSNKKPKFSTKKISKHQSTTRSRSCDFVLPKHSHLRGKFEERTCQRKEKQDLARKTQVAPQDCALPGATLHHKTVNANIRTLKLLRTRKDVTCGKTENGVSDKKESSETTAHEKCVPDNVCHSHRPSGQSERELQLILKHIKDNKCEKHVLKLNQGRNMPTTKPFIMENRWLAELQIPKSKKKKMESYEEFVSGLGKAAKKAKGGRNCVENVNTLTYLYDQKQDRTSSHRNTSINCKPNEVPGKYSQNGKQKDEKSEENISLRSSTPTENDFELASHRSKLGRRFAVDDKRLAASTVLTWPKDIYGCRKNGTARPITTSTYTPKPARVNPLSRTHFNPKSTQATKTCVDAEPAMIPTSMNGTLKKTSNVLPVNNFENDSVEDSDLSDETGKDTIELDQFFVSISK